MTTLLLAAALPLASGCYYAHLAAGQARLLWESRPLEAALGDDSLPPHLRERLALAQRVRAYAETIGLRVGERYTNYVPVTGDRVITTVVATEPDTLDPRPFWFPLVGAVPYKGFFDRERAQREAHRLETEGLDTCLFAVPAYSTLGWLEDPLTTPMLRGSEVGIVELLLHELLHATVYVPGDADFNEGLATFVGRAGAVRFIAREKGPESEAAHRARAHVSDQRRLAAALGVFRESVAALYDEGLPPGERAERRAELENETRTRIASLPLHTLDPDTLADTLRLNDACQALAGTYHDDLGAYAEHLESLDGNLPRLVEAARKAAEAPEPRAALLGGLRHAERRPPPGSAQ